MRSKVIYDRKERNYGILTDISKTLNKNLGDSTGRTVSRRTAQGLQKSLNKSISNDTAEDVVHAGMVATAMMISSENENTKLGGILIGLGLLALYQKGK